MAAGLLLALAAFMTARWQQTGVLPHDTRYRACRIDPADLPPPPPGPDGLPANYLHTCYDRLYDSRGTRVQITGLNWFGLETGTFSPHGLWTRNWQGMLDQIADLGYNTIRLPFSNDLLHSAEPPQGINYDLNPDLRGLSGLEILDRVIDGARQRGLRVVLDRHRPTIEAQSELWYTEEVSEEQWIADWRALAERYRGNDTVMAFDLHNEPRGPATWGTGDPATDWRLAAERAGNTILEVNPYLLVFVEGVEKHDGDWYWWGGNLRGVAKHPVRLSVPNRVVYSPHEYGPSIYRQGWFDDPSYPRNLPGLWDRYWGYIAREGIAPVVVGEFGAVSTGNDDEGVWQRSLVAFLKQRQIGYLAWSFNPNSVDTGGLLSEDWVSVENERHRLYASYLAPSIDGDRRPEIGRGVLRSRVKAFYRAGDVSPVTSNVSFFVSLLNSQAQPLDLNDVEIRYWLSAVERQGARWVVEIDWAAVDERHVQAAVVPEVRADQTHYLRLRFAPSAGSIAPYSVSGPVLVRLHYSDWSGHGQQDDFSFSPAREYREWDRVGVYVRGQLVWGVEP